jgi:hypothetical protein
LKEQIQVSSGGKSTMVERRKNPHTDVISITDKATRNSIRFATFGNSPQSLPAYPSFRLVDVFSTMT